MFFFLVFFKLSTNNSHKDEPRTLSGNASLKAAFANSWHLASWIPQEKNRPFLAVEDSEKGPPPQKKSHTLPETNSSPMKIPTFPGKYH